MREFIPKDKAWAFESYTLILRHEYEDEYGKRKLEEPYIMKQIIDRSVLPYGNDGVFINHMFDRFKYELMKRMDGEE